MVECLCECVCVCVRDSIRYKCFTQTSILTLSNFDVPATHTERYVTKDMLQNYVIVKMKELLISAEDYELDRTLQNSSHLGKTLDKLE